MKTGIEIIANERIRQMNKEGVDLNHDQAHMDGHLARAAACYALPAGWRIHPVQTAPPWAWPWEHIFWKPTPDNRIRELAKAGALIAAEIDRILNA